MISIVDADLKQLKIIFSLYGTWDKTIKTKDIYEELTDRLKEELDYQREQKNMILFYEILKNEKYIKIPKPIKKLSTNKIELDKYFDKIILIKQKDKEINNLVRLKKGLFLLSDVNSSESSILDTLNPIINNNSIWKNTAIKLLVNYYTYLGEDVKSKEYDVLEVSKIIEGLIKSEKIEQGGIGIYNTFTHYDIRGVRARWSKTITK